MCSTTVFYELSEDTLIVVANDEDFTDLGDFGDGGEAMGDDGVACEINRLTSVGS